MQKTSILIVDDHTLIRECLTLVLQMHTGLEVIADTGSGEEAVELAGELKPDIVLMDIQLPGIDGIKAAKAIRIVSPHSKILAISLHTNSEYARQLLKIGAMGYLCKKSSRSEMVTAIREIQKGRKYICQEIRNILSSEILSADAGAPKLQCITKREIQIINLIKLGRSSREIAEILNVTVKTVEVHRHNILKKLNLKNFLAVVNFVNTSYPGLNNHVAFQA